MLPFLQRPTFMSKVSRVIFCFCFPADGANTPVEILESDTPLIVEKAEEGDRRPIETMIDPIALAGGTFIRSKKSKILHFLFGMRFL